MLQVTPIPLLKDNYAYFLEDDTCGITAVVDPSQAEGVLTFLQQKNKTLNYILNTHHHWDHVTGNMMLKQHTHAKVVGYEKDAHRLPGLDIPLKEDQIFSLGASDAHILFIPGHTTGHIAYYFAKDHILFTGDTLFSLGCGRLFEGTFQQMWQSLCLLKNLPDETLMYCGHEYTLANLAFALSLDPHNKDLKNLQKILGKKRRENIPTVPSLLSFEKQYNPFLICETLKEFIHKRTLKDNFIPEYS